MNLNDLSNRLASDFSNIDVQAKHMLKIFICGSHLNGDKMHIAALRDEVRDELGIPGVFIMEDIEVDGVSGLHHKFELIWQNIMKGDNVPLCIVYAGVSAGESTGLNAEIQNIACDENKRQCTHIIRHDGVRLVDHANEFPCITVDSPNRFKRIAKDIISAKLNYVKSFLIYKGGARDETKRN